MKDTNQQYYQQTYKHNTMEKHYAREIINWAEEAKETLTVRKEIILDDDLTDEQLGAIIRMMYRAKERAQNETILQTKQNAGL